MKRSPKEKTSPETQVQVLKVVVKEFGKYLKIIRDQLVELEQINAKIEFVLSGKRPS